MLWRRVLALVVVVVGIAGVHALPVKEKQPEENKEEHLAEQGEDWELNLEYGRYLKEVVQALESDPSFRKKLETADVNDIKSGKIARELHFVDHNVRSKLDELKRRELERLRHLAVKEYEKDTGVDRNMLKIPVHLDYKNPTRFEVEDLKKLIVKTTEDLEKVDQQRRTDFKKYEMEKEFDRQQEYNDMDEEHRKQAEEKHKEEVQKHAQHPKLHHPGSKQQLEEVWEEQDHMQADDFDPKTFFKLHDLDGNGYWDEMEVKALFKKELDKIYDPNAPEDDMNERFEEMERMREHVFKESDIDRDSLISFKEFVDQTKRQEFEQDGGWQGLDEQELYSQQEYEEFQHQRQAEIQHLVESGAIPPPPGYHTPIQPVMHQGVPHPGSVQNQYGVPPQVHPNDIPHGYQGVPQGYQAHPQGYQEVPQGYQAHPQGYQGVPQGYQAHPQGYQAHPQQVQYIPQGAIQYQVPQGQLAPGQVTHGQAAVGQQHGQAAVGQQHGQAAVGQQHGQAAVGQQHGQGHIPLQPLQGNQIDQGHGQPAQAVQGQPVLSQPAQAQVIQGQHPQLNQQVIGQVPQPPQPVAGQPVVGQPAAGQPAAGQPAAGQPAAGQPVPAQ